MNVNNYVNQPVGEVASAVSTAGGITFRACSKKSKILVVTTISCAKMEVNK